MGRRDLVLTCYACCGATILPIPPPFLQSHAFFMTPEEAAQEVHRLLSSAVKRQMVSDVPIGAFLSGGVDSMAVLDFLNNGRRNITVLHFNHGTPHGYEAKKFVRNYCFTRGIGLLDERIRREKRDDTLQSFFSVYLKKITHSWSWRGLKQWKFMLEV